MTGNRKFKGFLIVNISLIGVFVGALLSGTIFTGDNIIVFSSLIAANGGMFFGANFGEHWSKKEK